MSKSGRSRRRSLRNQALGRITFDILAALKDGDSYCLVLALRPPPSRVGGFLLAA
jgi:hypothetical protein